MRRQSAKDPSMRSVTLGESHPLAHRQARILVVTESWPVQVALDQALAGCGLAGEVVGVGDALLVQDRPIVLFHAERWDSCARRDVERLAAQRARVLVVSRDAYVPGASAAILASGADVAASEDEEGIRHAAHVAWLAVHERARVAARAARLRR